MRIFLLILFTLSFLPILPAQAASTAVFKIRAKAKEGAIDCTATLLRLEGRCALITSKHCLSSGADHVSISGTPEAREWFAPESSMGTGSAPQEVRVLAKSGIYDLAELEIPRSVKSSLCGGLSDSKPVSPALVAQSGLFQNVSSIGFVNGKPNVDRTGGSPYGMSELEVEPVSCRPSDVLIKIPELDIFPGMSGGAVVDQLGALIGINAHYVPFQTTGFAIPLATIAQFLRTEGAGESSSNVSPPNNRLKQSGGNTQADPGGNTQADPGSHKSNLETLVEPLEGYPLPDQPGMLLLGVSGFQIDGYDDFQLKYLARRNEKGLSLVTRTKNGYPGRPIRKEILSRLGGDYVTTQEAGFSHHVILAQSSDSPLGWKKALAGELTFSVSVDPDSGVITLAGGRHPLRRSGEFGFDAVSSNSFAVRFKTEISKDTKTIRLLPMADSGVQPGLSPLECDNRNYLKLICANDRTTFSLSLSQIKGGEMAFRYSRKIPGKDGKDFLDYFYGSLGGRGQ